MSEETAKSMEELKEAEATVIHQSNFRKVLICGSIRELRPLPIKPSRKLSSVLNRVVRGFNKIASLKPEERDATALAGQEDEVANSLVEAMLVLADYYKWPLELKDIEEQMSTKDIRSVLLAQAELNEEDDFLLVPLRVVLQVLSQTTNTILRVASGTPASTLDSATSGELIQ